MFAGGGSDTVRLGPGADQAFGGPGADVLVGQLGPDDLKGGRGTDVLRGKKGNDTLDGSKGRDRCEPGAGAGSYRRCETIIGTAKQMLGSLRTGVEDRTGYDRGLFKHWSDLNGNGCDTRQEVLATESLDRVSTTDGCRV